ncbi:actinobacterial surface-anchored protein domain [Corynebacterium mustelae]|uniref:Actinobacterial surface-anchored protein domain n=1 Tax=Corynebacterium mustelae TaxID=571915 RepID=A0A0G3GW67_9CORY|nr:choice-of-anchor M domain-containing protein [Corynebacterium mustelae]AKK05404.1 actinobacterial surface-anchored protein domain [Corynebacterium mustelae]
MKLRTRLTATVAAVATAAALSTSGVAHAQETTLSKGHVDVFHVSATDDGGLKLNMKEDITGIAVERDAESAVLEANSRAWTAETKNLDFVGKEAVYLPLSQAENPEVLFPGWDTTKVRTKNFKEIDLKIKEFSGPGELYLFNRDGGKANPVAADGNYKIASGSVIPVKFPTHAHAGWVFTKPGTYTMKVEATGNGKTSNTATYTFKVAEKEKSGAAPAPAPGDTSKPSSISTGGIIGIVIAVLGVLGAAIAALMGGKLPRF